MTRKPTVGPGNSRPLALGMAAATLLSVLASVLTLSTKAQAYTYKVGPGMTYEEIEQVPWESLAPGDTVAIHHRAEDYRSKWVICREGTVEQPIVVRGIPSGAGERPVVNGIDAVTRPELNFWNEARGIIKIGGANNPPDTMPEHIIIEGLDIRSGRPPYTFTGRNGLTPYASNCAAIFIEKGEHILIRDCVLRDCGNGLFCAHLTSDLVVEANQILENGIEGSIYEHNNYTEAFGIVFQYNYFGPLRADCLGNNLKDRSAGTVVRYNWIESGNRQLDLVDSDYPELYGDDLYRRTFVYGNILVEPDGAGNSQILHYGGDSGINGQYRKGTLYLHHNTIVSTRSGNTTLARLSTMEETCDAGGNIAYVTAPGDRLAMISESGGIMHLRGNWLKNGWVVCHGSTPGLVVDYGNVEGDEPGFVDLGEQDFELVQDSPCIDAAAPLDSLIAAEHRPVMEYVRHALHRPRPDDGSLDIGAYEFAASSGLGDEGGMDPDGGAQGEGGRRESLLQAGPSPFRHSVFIRGPAGSRFEIVGVSGRVVAAGEIQADGEWNWAPGDEVPAGVYFLRALGQEGSAAPRVIRLLS